MRVCSLYLIWFVFMNVASAMYSTYSLSMFSATFLVYNYSSHTCSIVSVLVH